MPTKDITNNPITCLIILTLFLCPKLSLYSQQHTEQINNSKIKTIQLHRVGWILSDPIILLNSDEQLQLSFDELTSDSKTYSYSFVQCNSSWEPTSLMPSEYLEGYQTDQIEDYSFSFNTTFDYVHYSLTFPNEDIKIKMSGNYIIKVFENYNENNIIFTKRFYVTEQLVKINPEVRFPLNGSLRNSRQQLNFSINHQQLAINDPYRELKVMVQQNNRTDNMIYNLKPDFIRPNEVSFEYNNQLIFDGGNEFRWLDIRSTRFLAEYVRSIEMLTSFYHAELIPDKIRNREPYFYKDDSNGKYVVSVREYNKPTVEADYIFVHFYLPAKAPIIDGDIYIIGELTSWQLNQVSKMTFNMEKLRYENTLLLKQGFYNYQYLFVPKNGLSGEIEICEGNNSIAENDYHIFVYHQGPSDYSERLVGVTTVNSIKPIPIN